MVQREIGAPGGSSSASVRRLAMRATFGGASVPSSRMMQAALGFRVHTGWAAMVATARWSASTQPTILDRRCIEIMAGSEPDAPPFVYHAAAKLTLDAAECFVRDAEQAALTRAKAELGTVIRHLYQRGYEVVGSGVIIGNRPFSSPLDATLRVHALIHAAEGELFRQAFIRASEAQQIPVTGVPMRELYSRAVKHLRLSIELIRRRLNEAGRDIGKPWGQDQKESLLVAQLAFRS